MHEQRPRPAGPAERGEQLDGRAPGPGQVVRVDAPDAGDVRAGGGVVDLAVAGELVGLLAVLAPALAVALAGDRSRSRCPTRPGRPSGQRQVDRGGDGVGALGVLLGAAAGQDERARAAARRRAAASSRAARRSRSARHAGRPARRAPATTRRRARRTSSKPVVRAAT